MRLTTARALVDAAGGLGLDVRLVPDYGGRGMYGRTTAAVTADRLASLFPAVARAALDLASGPRGPLDAFLEDVSDLAHDSMGRGVVVY